MRVSCKDTIGRLEEEVGPSCIIRVSRPVTYRIQLLESKYKLNTCTTVLHKLIRKTQFCVHKEHNFVYKRMHDNVLVNITQCCVHFVHKFVDECYVHIDVYKNVYILYTIVMRVWSVGLGSCFDRRHRFLPRNDTNAEKRIYVRMFDS